MHLVVCLIILFVFAVALIKRHLRSSPVMFFSCRSLPLQQQRRGHVDDIEFNLMQHPLALFPHLEESLPPDVSCHRLGLAGGKTDNWVFWPACCTFNCVLVLV